MADKICQYCSTRLSRDEVGLSQKLLENETRSGRFTCIPCLAEILEVEQDELREKVEAFKREGCKLFG